MLGLPATSHSTPGVRAQLDQYQAQLQQARREATQAAERVARLEQQTHVARQESVRADERVRDLEGRPQRPHNQPARRRPIASLNELKGTLLDETA